MPETSLSPHKGMNVQCLSRSSLWLGFSTSEPEHRKETKCSVLVTSSRNLFRLFLICIPPDGIRISRLLRSEHSVMWRRSQPNKETPSRGAAELTEVWLVSRNRSSACPSLSRNDAHVMSKAFSCLQRLRTLTVQVALRGRLVKQHKRGRGPP